MYHLLKRQIDECQQRNQSAAARALELGAVAGGLLDTTKVSPCPSHPPGGVQPRNTGTPNLGH
ncbi:Glyoxylate/hydroxypyruvate reductase A [Frankliniella fusca]|uniref:Glyoxylate/hydroxypyruvate reductase A n=1 Tax=Frankliniella fusca TaxID=407009 RepID=A0AAE1HHQ0_9NEOP|nr:Glyoxylate/hydroxypyruvate reductase A [Frankliniella fusca]